MMTRSLATMTLIALLLLNPVAATADVVTDWNAIMVATVSAQNPFAQGRFAAITQLAVFEAVNAITGDYHPYLGAISAPPDASPDAAAAAAAHAVLKHYFPANAATLDAELASSLAMIPDDPSKSSGIEVGTAAAAAMIAQRANDGSAPPQFYLPAASEPGEWQTTPGCPPAGGILFHWKDVTPFGVKSSHQFRSAPPPALRSFRYKWNYDEVKKVGAADSVYRPADKADVAQFYNVRLAVSVWNDVARQIAGTQLTPLSENARALALLNMAISDALVTVMETKYYYAFWRPVTAIPAAGSDGNPQTVPNIDYVPFIATPCFPSYPSAHASASYAASRVLQRVWGNHQHSLLLTDPTLPQVVLDYTRLEAITDDIDDARVYGGIHFRFDQTEGATQGRQIGDYIYARQLRRAN